MALKKIPLLKLNLLAVFTTILLGFGCASVQKPQGGPRDTVPPKLLSATPPNKTKDFTAKQIVLDFDEYFKLNNQYQEITISPALEKPLDFHIKQKSLVINIKDTLQKNTTYVINFGKAIGDVNENNILKNFTYVFSTGKEIDSLSISGKVINAETQQPEKEATVFIFTAQQDSALFGKKKPSYYSTTDSSGNFKISNLHENTYRIYALKEASPNRIYDNDDELIAILPEDIHLNKDITGVELILFKQIPSKFKLIERRIEPDGSIFFTFNKSIKQPSLKILSLDGLDNQKITEFNDAADTARMFLKNMEFDSIKVAILSAEQSLDTVTLRRSKRDIYKRTLKITNNLAGGLKPKTNLQLSSNYPIQSINEAQIVLNEDSVPKYGFSLQKDTSKPGKYILKYPFKIDKHYDVTFNEGTFIDIFDNKNKPFTLSFNLNKEENYGTMIFNVTLTDSTKSYLFQLLNDEKKLLKTIPINRSQNITFSDYPVGKYRVRVVFDLNKNGKWDTGNVKNRTLPEPIWYYKKDIILRANWESTENITVPRSATSP